MVRSSSLNNNSLLRVARKNLPPPPRTRRTPPTPLTAARTRLIRAHGLFRSLLPARLEFVLRCSLAPGAVPIVHHLRREHGVQQEPRHVPVQDQPVGDFLQGGEDAGEGTGEVVEDLDVISKQRQDGPWVMACAWFI